MRPVRSQEWMGRTTAGAVGSGASYSGEPGVLKAAATAVPKGSAKQAS